jgi:hypothetical protein
MNTAPRAFLSYSHVDRNLADKIAKDLQARGVEVWYDKWEILPGDSLTRKIFGEGLARATVFIVILSERSIQSRWVQDELDVALIKRIEGVTRIIPIITGNVHIPDALRPLRWIDLSEDYDKGIRELQMAIFQIYERPPVGQAPEFVKKQLSTVKGLSRLATTMGLFFITTGKHDIGNEETFTAAELSRTLSLSPEETDDAIDELEKFGFVKTVNYLGTAPFSHGDVTPTYALFLHFRGEGLNYDPQQDILVIANALVAQREINGQRLAELTDLSPLRINRAVAYLEDYGLVRVVKVLGTAPFDFHEVLATGETRRFVADNAR